MKSKLMREAAAKEAAKAIRNGKGADFDFTALVSSGCHRRGNRAAALHRE